ncbi:helix-turn-helix transcriptional regulator [Leuconostocaceae bacterium ESL0723]|nr:helix-turn-helix transcriptional regulator [Leuconostocaceae bacterium ESL0723]
MKNRIQELRKDQHITQADLANHLQVSRQTVISLEQGRYNASLILAHKIAEFFNQSIEDIFIFEGEEQ